MIASFRHGGVSFLSVDSPLAFCGLDLVCSAPYHYGLSRGSYRSQVPRLTFDQFFGPQSIYCDAKTILTAGKRMIGAAIWLNRTRFDLRYITIKLATLLVPASRDLRVLQEF